MTEPLVTVNILSYNRKNEIAVTLNKVFEQDYKNIEVIVVDNASTDGTASMIRDQFPLVHLISMKSNMGCTGWNEGIKVAKGDYILVLDDNAYPKHDAISKCIDLFRNDHDRKIACIAFNIFNLRTNDFWKSNWQPSDRTVKGIFPLFVACAFMLDAKKILVKELMPEHYFMFQIELSTSAKIYNLGYHIYYSPDIIGYHWFFDNSEYSKQKDILIFQNNLFFIIEFLPIYLSFFYALQCLLFFGLRAFNRDWLPQYRNAVYKVFFGYENNQKISLFYFFHLRRLHIFNLPLTLKLQTLKQRIQR